MIPHFQQFGSASVLVVLGTIYKSYKGVMNPLSKYKFDRLSVAYTSRRFSFTVVKG